MASDQFFTESARAADRAGLSAAGQCGSSSGSQRTLIDPTCDNITTVAYSNPSGFNTASICVDQSVNSKVSLFATVV